MCIRPVGSFLMSILLFGVTASGAAPAPQPPAQDPNAQQQYPPDQQQYPPDQQQGQFAFQNFSPDELDNLLAPIALYPDPLLAQVLVSATFPDQIDEAARYLRAGADPNTIDVQPWDVSVKSVAHYPTVLYMMDNRLDWTTSVGQAYVNQSTDVQTSIQRLRAMAHNAGTLVSGPQIEVVQQGPYWNIYPVSPQLIFVPVYNPAFVFYGRPGWVGPYITFGVGFPIGAWLNLGFAWGGPGIYYFGWGGVGVLPVWAVRARPYVRITNVYVNDRFRTVAVNRTVINRPVNYGNLNQYTAVHREANFAARQPSNFGPGGRSNARPTNQIVQRNINTGDARIQDFRGRDGGSAQMTMEGQGRPAPAQAARPSEQRPAPAPAPAAQPAARPSGSSAYNVERDNFSPSQSSARGQSSVQQMNRPAPAPKSAPAPSAAPRSSGGKGRP